MPTDNPYAPPLAPVSDLPPVVPDDILKRIKQGWIAALISAGFTLIFTLLAMSGTVILNFSAEELVDVALICGLAYGIYRKSRVCAVSMLVYFVASKIYIMAQTGKPSGLAIAALFAYYFWRAMTGTFAYHKFLQQGPLLRIMADYAYERSGLPSARLQRLRQAAQRERKAPKEKFVARLRRCSPALFASAFLALPSLSPADAPAQTQCTATGAELSGLMEKTKLNAVMDYAGPESEYKSDGDPDTLELVFLPKKQGAISHVSDDGEVIFLYGEVRDKEQQQLITLAFCLRAVARRGPTTRSGGS